jgi:hypothetical protein
MAEDKNKVKQITLPLSTLQVNRITYVTLYEKMQKMAKAENE